MSKPAVWAAITVTALLLAGCAPQTVESENPQRIFDAYDYESPQAQRTPELSGDYLIALDDADPAFAGYPQDRRREADRDAGDTLTVVRLPLGQDEVLPVSQTPLPTAVAGPNQPMDISADGSFALVLVYEDGYPQELSASSGGMIPATGIVPVDLSDPMNPVVGEVHPFEEDQGALTVAISPKQDVALVGLRGSQEILVLLLDGPRIVETVATPVFGDDAQPKRPTSIRWHPSGRGFAVTMAGYRGTAFFRFIRDGVNDMIEILPWGEPVEGGPYPFTGLFSPDGAYYFTSDLAWSFRTGWFESASVGFISVYKVDQIMETGARHERLGSVSVGRSPTSIAISPDGSLIAVGNAEGGLVPLPAENTDNATDVGLLHLIHHDGSGRLEILTEVPTELIPTGVTFSPDGGHVLVAGYDENIVAIWEIQEIGGKPRLVDTTYGIETGIGPHDVHVID
jgi:hypothetical protein